MRQQSILAFAYLSILFILGNANIADQKGVKNLCSFKFWPVNGVTKQIRLQNDNNVYNFVTIFDWIKCDKTPSCDRMPHSSDDKKWITLNKIRWI